jgi:hypothetical protein
MPWQRLVADIGGELIVLDDGQLVPAYRDVVVTVPRQSGKTTLILSWMIQRAHGWGKPQRIAYSAQTGNDARKKLVEDWEPLLRPRLKRFGMGRILKGMGNEAVPFRNGSRIVLLASAEDSGHGKTLHLAVKDELFADKDFRRDQALVPAMSTVDDAQVLTSSTAGTDASIPLNALVARGRQAIADGRTEGIAYFEWSADEDDDLEDPGSWWSFMPALGHTQSVRSILAAKETLSDKPGEFRRAFGNLGTTADERIIPVLTWDACNSPHVKLDGRVAFGVDVNPERSWASIVAADEFGRVEVLEHRPTTGWLVEAAAGFARRWSGLVAVDPAGPAGTFREELAARCDVMDVGGRELGQACGSFYDDIIEGRAVVRRHPDLDAAVAGARKRSVGDAWAWARKDTSVDVSPLVAATLARWAVAHGQSSEGPTFAY